MQNKTPGNLEEKTLENLCFIGDGNHSSKYPQKEEFVETGIPFIRSLNFYHGNISSNNMLFITKEKHILLKKGHLKTNDILFTNRGEIGKVAIVSPQYNNANLNSQLVWLRCNDTLNHKFLYYFLCCPETQNIFKITKTGAALQQFPIKLVKKLVVKYPNIDEQNRIVKILDEAFENIEKAKQNTEQNLKNTKELFESAITKFYNNGNNGAILTIDDIAEVKGGKRLPTKEKLQKEITNHPYLRVTDFNKYGTIDESNIHYISDQVYSKIKNYTINSNDLYITIVGATIGKSGIIPKSLNGANLTENACKLVFKGNVDNKFIYYYTQTNNFKKQIFRKTKTTAVPKLALTRLKTFKIWIPDIQIQKKIVNKLDKLQEQTKQLEKIYEQKIKDLDELKQSILQKAFRGEL